MEHILRKLNSEDQKAEFVSLFIPLHKQLERYCFSVVFDIPEAEDIMSETVAIAFEKFGTLREKEKFRFFLFGTASRLCTKYISRRKTFSKLETIDNNRLYSTSPDPLMGIEISRLYKAIRSLPEHERESVVLFELSGFSLDEISQMKNMNINTVKTHLSRGRNRLKKFLTTEKNNTTLI